MGSLKVVLSSGWVTLASLKRRPMGRMNRSCFGGLRVKLSPTKVILLILRFQHFLFLFPERMTSNISASLMGLTFSTGTDHLPAFSFLFCLTMLVRTLELRCCSRSMRKVGTAPSSMSSALLLAFFSSCCLMVFFICIFSLNRSLLKSLALMPFRDWAFFEITLVFLAYFFLLFSSASSLSPKRFLCSYMQSFCGIPDVEKLQSHYPQTFINTKTEPGSEKSKEQKINRHLLQVQPLAILHQDLQSICLDLLLLGADGQILPLLCRVLLHHAVIEGLDFVEKRGLETLYDSCRFCYPLRQLLLDPRVRVTGVKQIDHTVVLSVSDHPSQSLVDRSNGSHEVPFLPRKRQAFIRRTISHKLQMILFLDNKGILYIGVWQPNHKYGPTHPIRKINALAHFPATDAHEYGSLS